MNLVVTLDAVRLSVYAVGDAHAAMAHHRRVPGSCVVVEYPMLA